MNIIILEDPESQASYAAEIFEKIAIEEIEKKGKFIVALSGGKTPALFFQKLSLLTDFPWDKTYIFLVDERFVSISDERSNYHLLEKELLRHIDTNSFKTLTGEEENVVVACENFKEILNCFFKGKKTQFDLMFLGLGADGHTASIFSKEDIEKGKNNTAIFSKPMNSELERVSLTLGVINSSKKIVFLVSGENKAEISKEVFVDKNEKYVASNVYLQNNNDIVVVLDKSSAKNISI